MDIEIPASRIALQETVPKRPLKRLLPGAFSRLYWLFCVVVTIWVAVGFIVSVLMTCGVPVHVLLPSSLKNQGATKVEALRKAEFQAMMPSPQPHNAPDELTPVQGAVRLLTSVVDRMESGAIIIIVMLFCLLGIPVALGAWLKFGLSG